MEGLAATCEEETGIYRTENVEIIRRNYALFQKVFREKNKRMFEKSRGVLESFERALVGEENLEYVLERHKNAQRILWIVYEELCCARI